ncbi:hypothetical protein SPV_2538 [Streptococcus pneumoniae]|nr:hypothetical protein SPV_2538 [Streptococcus pneumoniae]
MVTGMPTCHSDEAK